VDFVEICNVYVGKMLIKAAKRIFNSDKICRSYSDLNFGVTFLEQSVYTEEVFIYNKVRSKYAGFTCSKLIKIMRFRRNTRKSVEQHS